MNTPLRQGTATTVSVGPFESVFDAVSPLESLITQSGRIAKNGISAVFTPTSWGDGVDGYYAVGLAVGDVDTIGRLRISFNDPATHLPVWEDYLVLTPEAYDAWYASGAAGTDEVEFQVQVERI